MDTSYLAQKERLCILVLGMHRSGTSAITRVLSLMGAALPRDLMVPNAGNPLGHWEPETISQLNFEILTSLDRHWYDWRRIDRRVAPEHEAHLAEELDRQYSGRSPFVLKDPRICLLVPTYRNALARIGARTVCVFVLRNPMASSASLAARDDMSMERAELLWLRYLLEAEQATRGWPRRFVRYDRVLKNWRSAMAPVADLTGLSVPPNGSEQARAIDQFLDAGQRHHTAEQIIAAPPLGDWLLRANLALGQLAGDSDDLAAEAELDAIHRLLDISAIELDGAA